MAFLRKDKKGNEYYLRICKNVRMGKKVQQETLYSLGKVSDYSAESLQRIGSQLYVLGEGNLENLAHSLAKEVGRYNYGYPLVIKHLLRSSGIDTFLETIHSKHHLKYNLWEMVVLMLCNRWSSPLSKLGTYHTQGDFLGLEKLELQHFYRTLDKLSQYSDALQRLIYEKNKSFESYCLDVVFYDVTTFYFDSELVVEGSLRQKGFSKDGKIGQTQIVLGLLLDKNGLPVGYGLYAGSQYEGHTLVSEIEKLKKSYPIDKVMVVADSGMLNTSNCEQIKDVLGYDFLLGGRLKSLPKAIKKQLLDKTNYQVLELDDTDEEGKKIYIQYKTLLHKEQKLLCTYSPQRAKKDKIKREERIAKAAQLLKNPSQLEKKAALYFLKKEGQNSYQLDEQKIAEQALYGGLKVITCSDPTTSEQTMLVQYKHLYKIEQSFRTFKSFLETRPMFHWNDERIKGHFALCYLSFALLRNLQYQLKKAALPYTENELRRLLNAMQVSHLKQNKEDFYVRSAMNQETESILQHLKLKKLPNMTTKDLIDKYLT